MDVSNVMHGAQDIHKHVLTVIYVEFLAQTLELWDPTGVTADTVDVNVNPGDWGMSGAAPFVGRHSAGANAEAWCNCACYTNWPAGGGQTGQSPYCGNWAKCCAGGNMGGSGMVRITFA